MGIALWVSHIISIKFQFEFRKTRYRGITKNDNKLAVLFALSDIYRLSQLLKP